MSVSKQWVQNIIEKYEGKMSKLLGLAVPDFKFQIVSSSEMPSGTESNPAATVGDTIYINNDMASTQNPGMIVHEMTHVFTLGSDAPGKQTEGLADYVRAEFGLDTESDGSKWVGDSKATQKYLAMSPQEIRKVAQRHFSSSDYAGTTNRDTSNNDGGGGGGKNNPMNLQVGPTLTIGDMVQKWIDAANGDVDAKNVRFTVRTLLSNAIADGADINQLVEIIEGARLSNNGQSIIYENGSKTKIGDPGNVTDSNGDGNTSFDEWLAGQGAGDDTDTLAYEDYLAALNGTPITGEIRRLAHEAEEKGWTQNEWTLAVQKSTTYIEDQSVSYQSLLQTYGIDPGKNVDALIAEAVKSGYTSEEFRYFLRQTPEYRHRFKGIFYNNGNMRITEDEYLTFEYNLETLGKEYGYNIKPTDIGQALRKGITSEQYEDRLTALQRMNEYAPAMKAFQRTLKARGLLPPGSRDWTKREEFDFVTGQSNPKFYGVWEEASAATAAHNAGIDVIYNKKKGANGYDDIRRNSLMKIIKQLPGYQTEEDLAAGFATLGEDLLEVLPLSEARTYGLTKRDLIQATFGGNGAAKARQKVKHVIATHEAFNEDRASEGFGVQGGRATTGSARSPQQGSEY